MYVTLVHVRVQPEHYADAASAIAHKDTAHYLLWRDTVAPWMAQPRRSERFTGLFPTE